jgi:hypothetical protein
MLKLDKLLELYGYNKLFNTNDDKQLSKYFTYNRTLMMGIYYNKNSVTLDLDKNRFGIGIYKQNSKNKKCSVTHYDLQKNEKDLKSIFCNLEFNYNILQQFLL